MYVKPTVPIITPIVHNYVYNPCPQVLRVIGLARISLECMIGVGIHLCVCVC